MDRYRGKEVLRKGERQTNGQTGRNVDRGRSKQEGEENRKTET